MKNYQELIGEANNQKDWDAVIKLATEAKNLELGEVFLGIRKGYVNLFTGDHSRIEDMFSEAGIKWFSFKTQPQLNKLLKSGELTLEMVQSEPIVIFSGKSTINNRLSNLNWPINNFTARTSSRKTKNVDKNGFAVYDYFCCLTNKGTNESISFKMDDNNTALKAIMRDKRIDLILSDF